MRPRGEERALETWARTTARGEFGNAAGARKREVGGGEQGCAAHRLREGRRCREWGCSEVRPSCEWRSSVPGQGPSSAVKLRLVLEVRKSPRRGLSFAPPGPRLGFLEVLLCYAVHSDI